MSPGVIKKMLLVFCFVFVCVSSALALPKAEPELFAVAKIPAPVLNVPDFSFVFGGKDAKSLSRDRSGLIREVEFIAFPGTVFKIKSAIKKESATIYEVVTEEYPYFSEKGYFVDSRFVEVFNHKIQDRIKKLPSKGTIIKNLLSSEGSVYVWGGNCKEGIPQLLSFYPPPYSAGPELKEAWMLKGVDCSGLLYEATGGVTPRNTSSLVNYGEPVKISNLNAGQIIQKILPLDLIVWKGHVIIVLDQGHTIESRNRYGRDKEGNGGGVKIRGTGDVLNEILEEKEPVDRYNDADGKEQFVIRRWYEEEAADHKIRRSAV